MVMAADGMVMGGDTWMGGMDGMDGMGGDHWARASPAPANARHRAIDTNAQAFHEGDRNLTSLAINLLDLPMDCSSEAARFIDGINSRNWITKAEAQPVKYFTIR